MLKSSIQKLSDCSVYSDHLKMKVVNFQIGVRRLSVRELFGHDFREVAGPYLVSCMLIKMLISYNISQN